MRSVVATAMAVLGAMVFGTWHDPANASHGAFQLSAGIYRIPFGDGSVATVSNDHHTHSPARDRIDIWVDTGDEVPVVAAASGFVRAVVENHGDSNDQGDGVDINGNPQDDLLEHSCSDSSTVGGVCTDYNNYVWIEHPNGEWTKYTHMATNSVPVNVGDWVDAGDLLGFESDIGAAGGQHVHFEVGRPNAANLTNPTPFCANGGHMLGGTCGTNFGINLVPVVCDIPNNLYVQGQSYTANPCNHLPPTASAGGPYIVDEGSTVQLDGTGSNDPDNNPLTYRWDPADNLDDITLAQPTFTGMDDSINFVTLRVSDQIEALTASDVTFITVQNVAPSVNALGDTIAEGGIATVRATFTDPGSQDTHTATVDWGDGTGAQPVVLAQLTGAGVGHVYGDNGVFSIVVTVTDDDGGSGWALVNVTVTNVAPTATLDVSGTISFPGGDYFVLGAGDTLPLSAHAADPGSDDLTFAWSVGDVNTYFNNGVSADLFPSPFGTFPFAADDAIQAGFANAAFVPLQLTVSDDDGGTDTEDSGAIVTGTAETTEGSGWWQHQFSGFGAAQIDAATAAAYLSIVNAVSSVFSETVSAATLEEAHAILSPPAEDRRARAQAALMAAWLQFASGAVAWNATVPLGGGTTIGFLDLMFQVEATILNAAATNGELLEVEQILAKVQQAY